MEWDNAIIVGYGHRMGKGSTAKTMHLTAHAIFLLFLIQCATSIDVNQSVTEEQDLPCTVFT